MLPPLPCIFPGTAASGPVSARGQLAARYSNFTWPRRRHSCSWQGVRYGIFSLAAEGQGEC